MERFSDWLLNELKSRDMSQSDLARSAGLGSGTISNIMSGNRKVGQDTLTAIARALRLPPALVFEKAGLLPGKSDDPWAEKMNHKIGQLSGARREMAERLLDTLLDEQERETRQALVKPAKP